MKAHLFTRLCPEVAPTAPDVTSPAARPVRPVSPPVHDLGISPLFEATVTGVQLRFKHLDRLDIISPPHAWFDAALARQIAVHLLNRTFDVPKRAIAGDIMRSREAVNRALRTVDERLEDPYFAASYAAMKRHAVLHAKKKVKLKR